MVESNSAEITEDEAALYDRQIRLWGLDAQKRLRGARVLLIHLGGLGGEIAKNLVLAGVKCLTIVDDTCVSTADASCQFFAPVDKIGANRGEASLERIQRLNPMVSVRVENRSADSVTAADVSSHDVVIATACSNSQLTALNQLCRDDSALFFAGDVYGFYGVGFSDLDEHEYAEEVKVPVKNPLSSSGDQPASKKARVDETRTMRRVTVFSPFSSALQVDWTSDANLKRLRRFSPTYFVYLVLQKFRAEQDRRPLPESRADDIIKLLQLRDAVLEEMCLPASTVDDQFTSLCFGELSPVCAVVGGVVAQEVVKAVSKKDRPLDNFFLFNGHSSEGVVESIRSG